MKSNYIQKKKNLRTSKKKYKEQYVYSGFGNLCFTLKLSES